MKPLCLGRGISSIVPSISMWCMPSNFPYHLRNLTSSSSNIVPGTTLVVMLAVIIFEGLILSFVSSRSHTWIYQFSPQSSFIVATKPSQIWDALATALDLLCISLFGWEYSACTRRSPWCKFSFSSVRDNIDFNG